MELNWNEWRMDKELMKDVNDGLRMNKEWIKDERYFKGRIMMDKKMKDEKCLVGCIKNEWRMKDIEKDV